MDSKPSTSQKEKNIIKLLVVGPLLTNCYLMISGDELLIIDPGGEPEKILEEIKNQKAKLKYIINTHGHSDHTLGSAKIRKITGAKILIHEAEKNFIKPATCQNKVFGAGFKADKFLKEGDKIRVGESILNVIHTPGHSKGSICLLAENFLFSGDTLFKDGHGRTDLPGGSERDLERSLKKLEKILKPGMTVYPGHGEIFKTGH